MKRLLPLLLSLTLLCAGCGAPAPSGGSPSAPPAESSGPAPESSGEAAVPGQTPETDHLPETDPLPEADSDPAESYTLDKAFTTGGRELTARLHGTIDRTDGCERCGVYKIEVLEGETVLQTLLVKDAIDAACAAAGTENYGDEDRTNYFTIDSGLALEDLNFDGCPDLRLIQALGTVNASWLCWLWEPENSRFSYAFELVGFELTADPETRQIITQARDGWGLYYTDCYQYNSGAGKLLHVGQMVENFCLEEAAEPEDALVSVWEYLPNVSVELKYATADNFTGQVIYDSADARLRLGTLRKLQKAQDRLGAEGYRLLIWDAYRPPEAQWKLWELCPDPNFVSDPNRGFSRHSRGSTVDVTLVTLDGEAVEMPSGFDEFSPLADRDYSDVSDTARANAERLEQAMTAAGFRGYDKEWWHYSDTTDYPVIQ
ncbi:M15 family metallopeptidase [Dysosmobacter sp.]|uniref:M15 family metallopeptidase n=1 Tax=Dysosmobacter sp. TaxID=2591382 RepID=UPI002A870BD0|nr:M15 family metallopeptidase [Dysosmobacter sp.]MDY3282824.1 M15 family metallopeptidase [Dysosmobacter sp.]